MLSPVSPVLSHDFTPYDISDIKWHHVLHSDQWRPPPCLTQFRIKNDCVYKLTFCCWMNFTLFLIFLIVYGAGHSFLMVDVIACMLTSGVWLSEGWCRSMKGKLGWEMVQLGRYCEQDCSDLIREDVNWVSIHFWTLMEIWVFFDQLNYRQFLKEDPVLGN